MKVIGEWTLLGFLITLASITAAQLKAEEASTKKAVVENQRSELITVYAIKALDDSGRRHDPINSTNDIPFTLRNDTLNEWEIPAAVTKVSFEWGTQKSGKRLTALQIDKYGRFYHTFTRE